METTNPPELTLAQRFAADTPLLFKKIGILGLVLVGIATSLTSVPSIPKEWLVVLGAVGGTMTVFSNLTVKDTSVLANPNATIADYSAVLADLPNQFEQLHAGIANTIAAVQSGQVTPAIPPADTIIVEPPAPVVDIQRPAADIAVDIAPDVPDSIQAGSNQVADQSIAPIVANGNILAPDLFNLNPIISPQN